MAKKRYKVNGYVSRKKVKGHTRNVKGKKIHIKPYFRTKRGNKK